MGISLKPATVLLALTGFYALVLLVITIWNWIGADRNWLTALNLYLPQAIWAVPGLVLSLLLFRVNRPFAWLPLLGVLWVLGPVMGCRFSTKALTPPGNVKLRMMTWNIKYGSYQLAPLLEELKASDPDVVFFQDAVGAMDGALGYYFRQWHVRVHGQYVIASKYPLSEAQSCQLPYYDDNEELLRCRMFIGPLSVALYNVHFKTPRRSLNAFREARRRPWYLPEAVERLTHNVRTRWLQALAVHGYLSGEAGPVIVAGDLNSPDSSMTCDTLRDAGLHDAFNEAGVGYGFTYGHLLFKHRLPWLRLSWMRIDHIMLSEGFLARRCWAGTGDASDHRPVIADLVLLNH